MQYFRQPLMGTDVAAMVFAMLSVLYLVLWLRDREQGMSWLAASYALFAAYAGTIEWHLPQGPYVVSVGWASVGILAIMSMSVGVVAYLRVPLRRRRLLWWLLLGPGVVLLGVLWLGVPVLRAVGNSLATAAYVLLAWVCFRAQKHEPGAGHVWVGLALLLVPGVVGGALLLDVDSTVVRFYGSPPLMLLGLALLTTCLLRRRRALEAEVARRVQAEQSLNVLNASLEDQVQQRTADLQHMLTGLESFNRNVSHDLRGPLGGIAGLARMARQALDQGDIALAQRVLPDIAQQADTSSQLVSALMQLAHVSDARLNVCRVELNRVVEEVVAQLALTQPQQAVLSAVSIGPLPVVDADQDLLRPVFSNLIGNALKFTQPGQVASVEVGAVAQGPEVLVYVKDHGVGFDTAVAEQMFQPFTRLHGSHFEGHGVGLSIVSRAVERQGGRVWAESAPGQGACFYFTLPAAG